MHFVNVLLWACAVHATHLRARINDDTGAYSVHITSGAATQRTAFDETWLRVNENDDRAVVAYRTCKSDENTTRVILHDDSLLQPMRYGDFEVSCTESADNQFNLHPLRSDIWNIFTRVAMSYDDMQLTGEEIASNTDEPSTRVHCALDTNTFCAARERIRVRWATYESNITQLYVQVDDDTLCVPKNSVYNAYLSNNVSTTLNTWPTLYVINAETNATLFSVPATALQRPTFEAHFASTNENAFARRTIIDAHVLHACDDVVVVGASLLLRNYRHSLVRNRVSASLDFHVARLASTESLHFTLYDLLFIAIVFTLFMSRKIAGAHLTASVAVGVHTNRIATRVYAPPDASIVSLVVWYTSGFVFSVFIVAMGVYAGVVAAAPVRSFAFYVLLCVSMSIYVVCSALSATVKFVARRTAFLQCMADAAFGSLCMLCVLSMSSLVRGETFTNPLTIMFCIVLVYNSALMYQYAVMTLVTMLTLTRMKAFDMKCMLVYVTLMAADFSYMLYAVHVILHPALSHQSAITWAIVLVVGAGAASFVVSRHVRAAYAQALITTHRVLKGEK